MKYFFVKCFVWQSVVCVELPLFCLIAAILNGCMAICMVERCKCFKTGFILILKLL